jgi:hypothetical protein
MNEQQEQVIIKQTEAILELEDRLAQLARQGRQPQPESYGGEAGLPLLSMLALQAAGVESALRVLPFNL